MTTSLPLSFEANRGPHQPRPLPLTLPLLAATVPTADSCRRPLSLTLILPLYLKSRRLLPVADEPPNLCFLEPGLVLSTKDPELRLLEIIVTVEDIGECHQLFAIA